jgi:hypothetical protein
VVLLKYTTRRKEKYMSTQNQNNQPTVYDNVLAITREQLSKAMSLAAELEALLVAERKKTEELTSKVAELSGKSEQSDK